MTQMQLDELVAHATGESLCEVRQRGFSLADPPHVHFDPEPCLPMQIDWDAIQDERMVALFD